MKFIVMGAGGVGGYFGARLAASGHDVGFVARGRHLRAMQEHGLKVRSVLGDIELKQVRASDDPTVFTAPDYVLFTVKSYDCEHAAGLVRPALLRRRAVAQRDRTHRRAPQDAGASPGAGRRRADQRPD